MKKSKTIKPKGKIKPSIVKENNNQILKKISLFFLSVSIIIVSIIAFIYTAKAEIYITPKIKQTTISFDVFISDEETDDQTIPTVKGEIWKSTKEKEKIFQVQNTDIEKTGRAKGEINIINNNTRSQTLVKTTRFLTPDNILFRLDKTVVIPSKGKIKATVTADKEGIKGDIKPPLKLTIPGLRKNLQDKIYGEVTKPFSGGLIKIGKLTEQDINQAVKKTTEEINEQAQIDFLANFFETKKMFPPENTDIVSMAKIIQQEITPEIGSETNEFKIKIKADIEGIIFDKEAILNIAQNKFINSLPKSERFISIDEGSLKISLDTPSNTNQTKHTKLKVQITGFSGINENFINKNYIKGKSKEKIEEEFRNNPQIADIEITLSPIWIRKIPSIEKNINIYINSPVK